MPLHAQWQRLQSLQEEPGVERCRSRTKVTQQLHTRLDDISNGAKCLDVTQTMIRRIRLDKTWELSIRPVKLTTIHDHTSNRGAMPTNKLGCGMNNDVSTMLERLQQVGRREGVVYNERQPVFMGDIRDRTNIQRIQPWVPNRFRVNSLGAVIDGRAEIFGVTAIDKAHCDTHLRQCVMKKVICPTIQTCRRHNFITCLCQIQNCQCLRCLP